jgi:hypothetical protein
VVSRWGLLILRSLFIITLLAPHSFFTLDTIISLLCSCACTGLAMCIFLQMNMRVQFFSSEQWSDFLVVWHMILFREQYPWILFSNLVKVVWLSVLKHCCLWSAISTISCPLNKSQMMIHIWATRIFGSWYHIFFIHG